MFAKVNCSSYFAAKLISMKLLFTTLFLSIVIMVNAQDTIPDMSKPVPVQVKPINLKLTAGYKLRKGTRQLVGSVPVAIIGGALGGFLYYQGTKTTVTTNNGIPTTQNGNKGLKVAGITSMVLFGGFSVVLFISGAENIGEGGRILQEKGL